MSKIMCDQCKERPATMLDMTPPIDGMKNFCDECLVLRPLDPNDPEDKKAIKDVLGQLETPDE